MSQPRVKPSANVLEPYEARRHEITALRALQSGTATPDQQKLALRTIVFQLCRTYDVAYRSEAPLDTAFAEGKRFAGLEIVRLLQIAKVDDDG